MDRYFKEIFGDPGDLALARQQLDPLLRYFQSGGDGWKWLEEYKASVKSMANQLEPLLRIAQLREDQVAVRNVRNYLRSLDAPAWLDRMGTWKVGAHAVGAAAEQRRALTRISVIMG